jgi:DNA-3-methyladenine glycosylase
MRQRLTPEFFLQDTIEIAQKLIGKLLIRHLNGQELSGRIVETEAYLGGQDPAAHSFGNRRTDRTETMYQAGGRAYVYFVYGLHYCVNVVTQKAGVPEAVLIRALEPINGIEEMKRRRGVQKILALTNGPAKLCQALAIDRSLNGTNLMDSQLEIADDGFQVRDSQIVTATRVGVDYAGDAAHWPLRFYFRDSPFTSILCKDQATD